MHSGFPRAPAPDCNSPEGEKRPMMRMKKWKPVPRAILATAIATQLLLSSCVSRQAGQASLTGRVPTDKKAENPYGSADPESFAEYIRTVFRVSQKGTPDGLEREVHLLKENPHLAELSERVAADPSDLAARFELARGFEHAGSLSSAFQQYEEVLKIDPEDAAALYGMARIWFAWGDSVEALDAASDSLALNAHQSGASELIGRIYLGRNQPELALAAFERGLSRDRENARLTAGAGLAWERLGREDRAQEHLEKALTLDPSLDDARKELGAMLARQGLLADAYLHLRQVEGDAMALVRLGAILLTAGRYHQARKAFQEALEKDSSLEEARMQLSRVEAQLPPPSVVEIPAFSGREGTAYMAALPAPKRFDSEGFTVVGGLQAADIRRQLKSRVDLGSLASSGRHVVDLPMTRELGPPIQSHVVHLSDGVFHSSSTSLSETESSLKLEELEPLPVVVTLPSFQEPMPNVSMSELQQRVEVAEASQAEAPASTPAGPGEIAAVVTLDMAPTESASTQAVATGFPTAREAESEVAVATTVAEQATSDPRHETAARLAVELANLNGNILRLPLQLRLEEIRAIASPVVASPAGIVAPSASDRIPQIERTQSRFETPVQSSDSIVPKPISGPNDSPPLPDSSLDSETAAALLSAEPPVDPDALSGAKSIALQSAKPSGSGFWTPKWDLLHSPWTLQLLALLLMLLSIVAALGMRRRRMSE